MKETPVPNRTIRSPDAAGPIKRPALKFAEFRLIALGISLLPTSSELKLVLTGASRALKTPTIKASRATCQI